MIYQSSLKADQYQQILDLFSTYLNDITSVINSVKKSIYEIINIHLHSSQTIVQPNLASVSANGKKTLDDLKRISSILRGYSRSKHVQREEEQTKRSRIQNSSVSKESQSRVSRYSKSNSSGNASRPSNHEASTRKDEISMVTFDMPQPSQQQPTEQMAISKLKNYRSLRSLNKTAQLPNGHKETSNEDKERSNNSQNAEDLPIFLNSFNNPQLSSRKRAKTTEKDYDTKFMAQIAQQAQQKVKTCISKHESDMNDIMKRNTECLGILREIHQNLKNKKKKKEKPAENVKSQIRKTAIKYQAMTPSSRRKDVSA